MSDSTLKLIGQQAKEIVRQVSGATNAVVTAEHTAEHLKNVELWTQQELKKLQDWAGHEFLLQRHAHEVRLLNLETRVARLEKAQNALVSAGSPSSSPKAEDALDVVSISANYYIQWQSILQKVALNEKLFDNKISVMELYSGAAKSCSFLQDKVSQYVGVEPSEVLRAAASRRIRDVRFSFVDVQDIAQNTISAELVILLAETQRWSVHDLETLLGVAESHLADTGRILIHIPYSFADLEEAGWELNSRLLALGLELEGPEKETAHGSYVLIGRK